jgi:hypothetical protein
LISSAFSGQKHEYQYFPENFKSAVWTRLPELDFQETLKPEAPRGGGTL